MSIAVSEDSNLIFYGLCGLGIIIILLDIK